MPRHIVARASEVAPGQRKLVNVGGRPIAIFNVGGQYHALLNRCPHQGASLIEGDMIGHAHSREPGEYCYDLDRPTLKCTWHGWEFDLRTGQSLCDPETLRVKSYPVERADGHTLAKGPYVAETFAVTIEEEYLVVDV